MLVNNFLEHSAELYPQKIALVCHNKKYTFIEIEKNANSFGNALIEEGFQPQDRAVIYLDNSVESVTSIFGILKAGGIFVIVNPQVKVNKFEYILADCQARALITDSRHLKQISEVVSNSLSLKCVIITDYEKAASANVMIAGPKFLSYCVIIDQCLSSPIIPRSIDIDLAGLIYTSGSSGRPKGVMLTHHNMVSAATSIIQYLDNNSDDIILDTLPLSFDYGLYQVLMAFKFGGTVILEKAFVYPEQIIDIVIKEKVTGWPMVPTIVAILLRLKNLEKHDFSCLRYITSTGQALPSKHIAQLRQVFPKAKIYSMYGLTECKRVSYLPPDKLEEKPDSVGKAMPNTEVYIVDEEGKVITEAGIAGELVVRGSNVMKGYWNLPEETARTLRPGHYLGEKVLFTGDLFKKDSEGYLYFLGRKDDIIKTAGHMVSPKEIENVLCGREDVIEAAVVSVDDEILGQAIKAFIHLDNGSNATEKDIIRFCYDYLEDFAVPKYVSFCQELPRLDSGKVRKLSLRLKSNKEK